MNDLNKSTEQVLEDAIKALQAAQKRARTFGPGDARKSESLRTKAIIIEEILKVADPDPIPPSSGGNSTSTKCPHCGKSLKVTAV